MSGQAGAPILLIEDNMITVIEIHKGAKLLNSVIDSNCGRLVTTKLV